MSSKTRKRWGDADAAGAECKTERNPNGVPARTYRAYRNRIGAPGPVRYNPETGVQEYDLDAVAQWNSTRGGSRGRVSGHVANCTAPRFRVLAAAEAGELVGDRDDPFTGDVVRAGEPLPYADRYAVTDLHNAGHLAAAGRRIRPTAAGRKLLEQWRAAGGPPKPKRRSGGTTAHPSAATDGRTGGTLRPTG